MIQIKIFIARVKFFFKIIINKIVKLYKEEKFKFWAIVGAIALLVLIVNSGKIWNAISSKFPSGNEVSSDEATVSGNSPFKEYEKFKGLQCYEKGCTNYTVDMSYYCEDHICQWRLGCLKRRDSGDYCWDHVCMNPTCQNPMIAEGYQYCAKHYLELYPDADIDAIMNPAISDIVEPVSGNTIDTLDVNKMKANQEDGEDAAAGEDENDDNENQDDEDSDAQADESDDAE